MQCFFNKVKEILLKNVRGKGNRIEKMCAAKEVLLKNVRGKGNPIEKCARQRKSYRKMCAVKEIL